MKTRQELEAANETLGAKIREAIEKRDVLQREIETLTIERFDNGKAINELLRRELKDAQAGD